MAMIQENTSFVVVVVAFSSGYYLFNGGFRLCVKSSGMLSILQTSSRLL